MEQQSFTYYLVIIADRQKGKYFLWYDNTFLEPGEEVLEDMHKNITAHNRKQGKFDRYFQEQLHKHLKYVGERALTYTRQQQYRIAGIILGGHSEVLSPLKASLPSKFTGKVVGEFIASPDLSVMELVEKAKKAISK